MSQLGWVDFSSTDREQVSKILSMLREPATLDELGVGQIRDAFADLLFPGFSTIQTRAKYLITVPRIFRDYHLLQSKEKKRKPLLKYLKEKENEVAQHLVDKHGNNEEGIIGGTMVGKGGVARRPSSVYWNAFRQFGIIKESASLNEFCHKYEQENVQKHYALEHEEGVDDGDHYRLKNKVEVPSYDPLWLDELSMDLTKEEAEFLYLYIMQSNDIADSIPSQLFTHGLLDTALEDEYQSIDALTLLMINDENISPKCKNTLKLASEFSLAMEGPHIRYNIVIARKNGFEHNVEKYQKEYTGWLERVEQEKLFYVGSAEKWLDAAAKDYTRPFKPQTVNFIKEWSRHIQEKSSDKELDFFVEKQALRNKGSRSLLKKKIVKDGWIGIRRLDYRWPSAIKILRDIQKGLKGA